MSYKTLITVIVIVSVAIVMLMIWLRPDHAEVDAVSTQSIGLNSAQGFTQSSKVFMLTKEDVRARIQSSLRRRHFTLLDEGKLIEAVAKTQVFDVMDEPVLSLEKDGRAYIRYDPYILETKDVGDKLNFLVSELGLRREAIIQRVDIDPQDDIVSWSGYLQQGDKNNESFHISQSIKDQYAAGSITTLDGTYTIEAKNGTGWVIPPSASSALGDEKINRDH